ncbi:MAG: hypothetical protein JWQ04_2837 [Pedosphaera sp.]|nr:hypothetical protein [Pedosphaera sp.]
MKKRVYIGVNGIRCPPGDPQNWNGMMVDWIHRNTNDRAVMFEYYCDVIWRAFFQKSRAEKLAAKIEAYAGDEIILVGHSNGTDLILKALALMNWPRIEEIHLVSAACEADFKLNGLNGALKRKDIGVVHVWMSGRDSALQLANCWLGRLLGYGVLGLTGPKNVDPEIESHRIVPTLWSARDHSDCFKPYCFGETMRGFCTSVLPMGEKP